MSFFSFERVALNEDEAHRAFNALVDYAIWLVDKEKINEEKRSARRKSYAHRNGGRYQRWWRWEKIETAPTFTNISKSGDDPTLGTESLKNHEQLQAWESQKLTEWAARGLIIGDTLRVPPAPPRWTIETVRAAVDEASEFARPKKPMGEFDFIAVLYDADALVPEGYMDAKENIRAVIDEIVDRRLCAIFGDVLMDLRRGPTPAEINAERDAAPCPKCGVLGCVKKRHPRKKAEAPD